MKKLYLATMAVLLLQSISLEALIPPKGSSNVGEMTASLNLVNAAKEGDVNSLIYQIKQYGANPSTIDLESGKPVLIIAIETGILNDKLNYANVAKILIESGADVNATDQEGYTPLDYLYKTGAMGMRNLVRERTRQAFSNTLKELLQAKGAVHSEKYKSEKNYRVLIS